MNAPPSIEARLIAATFRLVSAKAELLAGQLDQS